MRYAYICSSLRQDNYDYVTNLLQESDSLKDLGLLRPHVGQLQDKHNFTELDVAMIKHSDFLLVIGEYGRDCSWEIGYAMGIGKPVTVAICPRNRDRVDEDWMLHHGKRLGLLSFIEVRGG